MNPDVDKLRSRLVNTFNVLGRFSYQDFVHVGLKPKASYQDGLMIDFRIITPKKNILQYWLQETPEWDLYEEFELERINSGNQVSIQKLYHPTLEVAFHMRSTHIKNTPFPNLIVPIEYRPAYIPLITGSFIDPQTHEITTNPQKKIFWENPAEHVGCVTPEKLIAKQNLDIGVWELERVVDQLLARNSLKSRAEINRRTFFSEKSHF